MSPLPRLHHHDIIAVRARVRARVREWNFSLFFSLCKSVRKELCDVRMVRIYICIDGT